LSDRAKKNLVNPTAIFYALKRINFSSKKKQICYRKINIEERIKYYQKLGNFIKKNGNKSLVFIEK